MKTTVPSEPNKNNFRFMMRALSYRNYRLFFSGQIISLVGTWMTMTASSWLVYRLTGSALVLGIVGFASQFPAFILTPFAGVFVDRHNRHHLLITTQALSMLQSFALAFLTLTGRITVVWIVVLNLIEGLINAFDIPCRQTFVISLIEKKEDLGNAIALNSSMFNLARLLGPAVAGVIIASSNEGWCFFIDGVSFLCVITSLLLMVLPKSLVRKAEPEKVWTQLKDGWQYTIRSVPIRSSMILLALVSLVGVPYSVLVPVFAGKILHGGAHTLGFLMTASGCGALFGALWLATRKSVIGLGRIISTAALVFGAGLIAFSFSETLWLSLIIITIAGGAFMIQMASSNTILQTIVDDHMRGRVMSFFLMSFLGTVPFGSLLAGTMANRIGAPHTLLMGGILCICGALWFSRQLPLIREALRPIYTKMGILR